MVADLRGITVRQPWAEAIAAGSKLVENRGAGFPKNYRGDVLIHASKQWSDRGQRDTRVRSVWVTGQTDHARACCFALRHGVAYGGRPMHPFVGGAVLAIAEIVDIHPDTGCCRPWGESEYVGSDQQLHRGVTHIVLENVRRLPRPLRAKGALGLWKPDPDLLDAVAERAMAHDVAHRPAVL